jgi:cytochrome c oxidase assembly factor CtaG
VVAAGVLALAGLTVPCAGAALAGPAAGSVVPEPTLGRLLLSWSFDPLVTVGLLAAAIAYLQGRRRLVADRVAWPARRTAYFLSGIGALALAWLSPIEAYDTVLFSVHVGQHMLLTMVAAPLLALGAPVTLALRVAKGRTRRRMTRVLHSPPLRVVGHPLVAWVLFTATLYGLYFSPLFDLTLREPLVHDLVHLHFLAAGLLVGLDPSRWRLPHIARLLFVFLMVPFHAFLGVAIMNSGRVLAPTLESFQRTWGPTPLADQQVGGAILWGAGDLIALAAVLGVLISWASYEEKVVAVREDRRLARERAAGRPTRPVTRPPVP